MRCTCACIAYLGPENSIKTGSAAYQLLPELDLDPVKDTKISKQVYDAFLGEFPASRRDVT